MMRASQPDVPCPDNLTILTMLEYHNHLMSAPIQDEMCSGMRFPTNMKSAMVCSCILYQGQLTSTSFLGN